MSSARYYIALILLVSLPPGFLLWYAIHPFARFWRRLGPAWTYAVLAVPSLAIAAAVFRARHRLLSTEYGTSYPLIGVAVLALVASGVMSVKRRKYLKFSVLAGIPELSRDPGTLLTEGIYSRIRNPRYVEAVLGVLAYALFANYLAGYVALLLSLPAIHLIVVLEEKELRQRFGADYVAYCREVPRYWPKRFNVS